jgi:hypothetical protein
MQLITTCKVALEPTRISAVAECTSPSYLGDTELQAFLRCLGAAPTCEEPCAAPARRNADACDDTAADAVRCARCPTRHLSPTTGSG